MEKLRDPMARHLATVVWSLLQRDDEKDNSHLLRPSRSATLSTCRVHFMDGTSEEMIFDARSVVSDGLSQIAWSVGLQNKETFALLQSQGDQPPLLLDETAILTEVVKEAKNGKAPKKLWMKRLFFKETDDLDSDPTLAHFSYVRCREAFLKGYISVSLTDITKLGALQVRIHNSSSAIANLNELSSVLQNYIPQEVVPSLKAI